jgi:hypothetical protein
MNIIALWRTQRAAPLVTTRIRYMKKILGATLGAWIALTCAAVGQSGVPGGAGPMEPVSGPTLSGSIVSGDVAVGGPNTGQIQDSGAGLGLALISSQTANASASLVWTNLGTYNAYTLSCTGVIAGTGGNNLVFRVSEDNGSTFKSASYHYAGTVTPDTAAAAIVPTVSTNGNAMQISGPQSASTAALSLSFDLKIRNVASSTIYKMINVTGSGSQSGPAYQLAQFAGAYTGDTNAINGMEIFFGAGQIASGSCSLYGSVN